MSERAKVDAAVFEFLRPELKKYKRQTEDLARHVARTITKTIENAETVVAERRVQLRTAQRELADCLMEPNANCSGYRRRVQECQHALANAIKGRALIEAASAKFRHSQAKHTSRVQQVLLDGQKIVECARERVEKYEKAQSYVPSATILSFRRGASHDGLLGSSATSHPGWVGGGSSIPTSTAVRSSTRGWAEFAGVSVPTCYPDGFGLIPISLINDDNPVRGVEAFTNGQSVPDLRWAADALFDVVIPAMETVPDARGYLRNRDVTEGRTGDRGYIRTYDGFFGSDTPIKLSARPDGTFEVDNGRHRIWILSEAGATHLPARIAGTS